MNQSSTRAPSTGGHPIPSSEVEPTGTRRALVAGKYGIIGLLGRGGMSDVFLATTTSAVGVGKLVVIKKLRDTDAADASWASMFVSEARIATRLNHPNVVHTYDVGEDGGALFLAMEYVEGRTLRGVCAAMASRKADIGFACHVVGELLEGLDYAHDFQDYDGTPLGIVHRDVSPPNVLLTWDGRVKVLDFGIAKSSVNEGHTETGILKGKCGYMAPEQAVGGDVDRRVDVFASGVILWEMLTGERLFKGEPAEVLLRIMSCDAPPVSSRRPDVPSELDAIVSRALARNAEQRFATAGDMSRALAEFMSTAGLRVRAADVAATLAQLCPQGRDDARRMVEAWRATVGPRELHRADDSIRPLSRTGVNAVVDLTCTARSETTPGRRLGAQNRRLAVIGAMGVAALAVLGAKLVGGQGARGGAAQAATADVPAAVHAAASHAAGVEGAGALDQVHLTLSSDPPEAQIEWGGKPVGLTPLMIDLEPGPQTFVVKRDGYLAATIIVNVTAAMSGRGEARTVVLVPRKSAATASAPPAPHAGKVAPASPPADAPASQKPAEIARVGAAEALPVVASAGGMPVATAGGMAVATASGMAVATEPARAVEPVAIAAPAPVSAPRPEAVAAPAASPAATVLPYGPEMTRPRLLAGSDPVYPREAAVVGVEGAVIAKCTVTTAGTLASCRILKGLPFMDKPMLDALATRRYTPVTLHGAPVAVEYVFSTRIVKPR